MAKRCRSCCGPHTATNCSDCVAAMPGGNLSGGTFSDSIYGAVGTLVVASLVGPTITTQGLLATECSTVPAPAVHAISTRLSYSVICSGTTITCDIRWLQCGGGQTKEYTGTPIFVTSLTKAVSVVGVDCTQPLAFNFTNAQVLAITGGTHPSPWDGGVTITYTP